jgi:hypothetical protein
LLGSQPDGDEKVHLSSVVVVAHHYGRRSLNSLLAVDHGLVHRAVVGMDRVAAALELDVVVVEVAQAVVRVGYGSMVGGSAVVVVEAGVRDVLVCRISSLIALIPCRLQLVASVGPSLLVPASF